MARTLTSVKVGCKLNNGTTSAGAMKTLSVGIGTINHSSYSQTGAAEVAMALSYCLDRTLVEIYETQGARLTV